ncbi:hypothetical protein JRQ81_007594 [Phrynocephalus forsythii]|uniref:Transcobalamin-2 n=1 Tax=Phrynocephalus forsythii TaxID=171643 RepID=A0A9Q1ATG0_9SAUR|nr:hypothetical protein JRQ81_007594 [Phrynocephalus forsythii]
METPEGNRLITQLKLHLHKEKLKIGHASDGYPITNYYQYSLGVLALCTHEKKIDEHVIHKLLHAEKHGLFRHNSDISVDTEAMAGLAFACLQQQTAFYPHELLAKLNLSLQRVTEKILQAQTSEGAFGNIYSSPLAVQFLIATRTHQKKPECPAAVAALFQSLEQGNFRNALIKSQLLPVFYGKSYLDITHKECQTERGGAEESLVLAAPTPASGKANPQRRIGVQLVVKRPPRRDYLYKQVLYVPLGSSLLDVLKAAERQARVPFTFETQNSLSGPMLTGVMGIKAEAGERKYWKILRAPHSVLDEGGYWERQEMLCALETLPFWRHRYKKGFWPRQLSPGVA